MQIPLIGGTRAGAGAGDPPHASQGQGQGQGRYKGSPSLLPITLLMHGEAGRRTEPDGIQQTEEPGSYKIPEVTVLIGGHSIGGNRPLVWTDDLEGFDLTPFASVRTSGSLSLHSLGIGGSSMLCVKSDPLSGAQESILLSGPVGLFRGSASGINGTVAQAILKTFRALHAAGDSATGGENLGECREDRKEIGCSSIVAEIIALMLLIQSEVTHTPRSLYLTFTFSPPSISWHHALDCSPLCAIPSPNTLISSQMGPGSVLQALLRSAFGMPLTETPTGDGDGDLQGAGHCSEMRTRASGFHSTCAQTVYASNNRAVTDRGGGVTVRAVLFDTFHSVSTATHLTQSCATCDMLFVTWFAMRHGTA